MSETTRTPLQLVGHVIAQILVGIYVIADSVLGPIFRPFMRWLSRLRAIEAIESGIAACPAYVVLALLGVPFAAEELAKVYSFVLMGGGHFKIGLIVYIAAHVFAILICERIFSAGKAKLMTIPWFARLFKWLEGYKDRMVTWFKSTSTYKRAKEIRDQLRDRVRQMLGRPKIASDR